MMTGHGPTRNRAAIRRGVQRRSFTLVELVIVVMIIGIIAAIAAPRFGRMTGSATATYIQGSIASVQRAMLHYFAEHGKYPGANPGTGNPDNGAFVNQLLLFSDEQGNTSATHGSPYIYGPYLRAPFPKNPFNQLDTVHVKATTGGAVAVGSTGWVAVLSTGEFGLNAAQADIDTLPKQSPGIGDDDFGTALLK